MESSWSLSSTQRIVFFGFIGSPGPWAQATANQQRRQASLQRRIEAQKLPGRPQSGAAENIQLFKSTGERGVTKLRAYYGCTRKNVKCRVGQSPIFLWRFLS